MFLLLKYFVPPVFSVARMADLNTKANLQSLQKVTGRFGYGFGMVTAQKKYNPESAQSRAAQFISDREGNLPVWVRAPKHGHEFYSGCTRPKLYEWAAKGLIRSVSIREPGRIKGVRLFHLASIFAFIERCEASAVNHAAREPIRPPAALESGR